MATDPLARWKMALAAGRATYMNIGDSVFEGRGSTARNNRWSNLLTASLRTKYAGGAGGQYYQPAWYDTDNSNWGNAYHTRTGGATPASWAGIGAHLLPMNQGQGVTFTVTGSSMDLWYLTATGAGTFTYKVDSGSAVSVPSNADYNTQAKLAGISLGTSGTHTITITNPSTAATYFSGVTVYAGDTNTGIHYYDAGHAGITAADFNNADPQDAVGAVNPDLVMVGLGFNDSVYGAVSASSFQTAMNTLVTFIQAQATPPSVLIIADYAPAQNMLAASSWANYVTAMQSVATAKGCGLLNLTTLMPQATTPGSGFYADGLHLNDSGNVEYAKHVEAAIAPSVAPVSGLTESLAAGAVGHIADHAVLKAEYDAAGGSPAIAAYTSSSTEAQHATIHNALHARHNALGAATTLPTNLTSSTGSGHLSHQVALHKAYNLRNGGNPATLTFTQTALSATVNGSSVTFSGTVKASAQTTVTEFGISVDTADVALATNSVITTSGTTITGTQSFAAGTYTYSTYVQYPAGTWTIVGSSKSFTVSGSGSGGSTAMPVGNLTGWNQVYTQDFTALAAIGQIENVYDYRVRGYADGELTTNRNGGYYYPSKVLSVINNVAGASNGTALDWYIHSEVVSGSTRFMTATPTPQGYANQTYGRYSVRMRADALAGYKTAFLLWPESQVWEEGEIDFPEGSLDGVVTGAVHGIAPSDPNSFLLIPATTTYLQNWHIYTIDWLPGHVRMYIDGVLQRDFTQWVPTVPMYWALQVETDYDAPVASTQGHLQVDWCVVYEYTS